MKNHIKSLLPTFTLILITTMYGCDGNYPVEDCEWDENLELSFSAVYGDIELSTDRWLFGGFPNGQTMYQLNDIWYLPTGDAIYPDFTRVVVAASGENCNAETKSHWVINKKEDANTTNNVGASWINNTPQTAGSLFSTKVVFIAGVLWDANSNEYGTLVWTKDILNISYYPFVNAGQFKAVGRWSPTTSLSETAVYYEDEFAEFDIVLPPLDDDGPAK